MKGMRVVRTMSAVLFVAGLALVLALPLITPRSDNLLVVRDTPAGTGAVDPVLVKARGISLEWEMAIAGGALGVKDWRLLVAGGPEAWCYSFVVSPGPEHQGVACAPPAVHQTGTQVMFTPAGRLNGLDRAVVVAALPDAVGELRLQATNEAGVTGHLVRPPAELRSGAVFLVAFLPPRHDIVEARATTAAGDPIRVGGLVDLVDAY